MKLKAKVSLLAGAIALAGVAYMPQASATVVFTTRDLGTLSLLPTVNSFAFSVGNGSFTDTVKFMVPVTSYFAESATLYSTKFSSSGVSLTSFELYKGADIVPISTGTVEGPLGSGKVKTYSATLDYALHLSASPTEYSLKIVGTGTGSGGIYSGTIALAPVPEPEEWAMMLVGAGLVSFQVRRKQKGLSQSTLA